MRYLSSLLVLVLAAGCCCPSQPVQDAYCCGHPPASGEVYVPETAAADESATPRPSIVDVDPTGPEAEVFIDCTVLQASENLLKDVGDGSDLKYLDATATEVILRAIQKSERVQVVQAPKLLALAGHEATIFIGETIGTDEPFTGDSTHEFMRAHVTGFRMTATPQILTSGRVVIESHVFMRGEGTDAAPLSGAVYESSLRLDLGPDETVVARLHPEQPSAKPMIVLVRARAIGPREDRTRAQEPEAK